MREAVVSLSFTYHTALFEEVEDTGLLDEDEVWKIGESVFE
jgi:hypothetical protein